MLLPSCNSKNQQKVKLDSPVCDYIASCPNDLEQIHLLHLLTHSSGLPGPRGISTCAKSISSRSTTSELMSFLDNRPLAFKPGERFNDSKFDYLLLRLLIERISGQTIEEYLDQHIFRRLQMSQTGFTIPSAGQESVGTDQSANCGKGKEASTVSPLVVTKELYSTMNDLRRWDRALATPGFLSKYSLEQMFTPFIEGYGLGWKIIKEFDRKVAIQYSEENSSSISIRIYPDDETCVIVYAYTGENKASTLSHSLGAILFGKHYPVSDGSPAAHSPH